MSRVASLEPGTPFHVEEIFNTKILITQAQALGIVRLSRTTQLIKFAPVIHNLHAYGEAQFRGCSVAEAIGQASDLIPRGWGRSAPESPLGIRLQMALSAQ